MSDGSVSRDLGFILNPVGEIRSCYREKFGIPRQPGLVNTAQALLELRPPYNSPEAVRGLDQFSHVWILFVFHASRPSPWKATVRPPRLGGNERVGVFASRSNFRPNPIGLSVVSLRKIGFDQGGVMLHLQGGDFLDRTPVLDIKPYIPYADAVSAAQGGFAGEAPAPENRVVFSEMADKACRELENLDRPLLRSLIIDMLSFNVRPAYQSDDEQRIYGTSIYDLNLRWSQSSSLITVLRLDLAGGQSV